MSEAEITGDEKSSRVTKVEIALPETEKTDVLVKESDIALTIPAVTRIKGVVPLVLTDEEARGETVTIPAKRITTVKTTEVTKPKKVITTVVTELDPIITESDAAFSKTTKIVTPHKKHITTRTIINKETTVETKTETVIGSPKKGPSSTSFCSELIKF